MLGNYLNDNLQPQLWLFSLWQFSLWQPSLFFTFVSHISYRKIIEISKKKEAIHNFCLSKISIFILVFIETLPFLLSFSCSSLPPSLFTHIHLYVQKYIF